MTVGGSSTEEQLGTENAGLIEFVTHGRVDEPTTCEERCVAGHYSPFGNLGLGCLPHSTPTCVAGYYLRAGTHQSDASCEVCRDCTGQRATRACSATANSECEACEALQKAHAVWTHANCTMACEAGYVLNVRTETCEACDHSCALGLYRPAQRDNCTHCEPCVQHIVGSVFRADCVEECEGDYELQVLATGAECVIKLPVEPVEDHPSGCLGACTQGTMCYFGACESCWGVPVRDRPVADGLPAEESVGAHGAQQGVVWRWTEPYRECAWECIDRLKVKFQRSDHVTCEDTDVFALSDESFVDETDLEGQRRAETARKADHRLLAFVGAGVFGGLFLAVIVSIIVKCVLRARRRSRHGARQDAQNGQDGRDRQEDSGDAHIKIDA